MENERRRDPPFSRPGRAGRSMRSPDKSHGEKKRASFMWKGGRTVAYPTENTPTRDTRDWLQLISAAAHMYLSK